MKRGTQVIYIPLHAAGNLDHADSIKGVVTSGQPMGVTVLCHFWAEVGVSFRPHGPRATDSSRLVEWDSVEQAIVDKMLAAE